MRIKDSYNYASPQYSRLYEPSRAVSKAYGEGNKWLDQLKEYVYIVQGQATADNTPTQSRTM